MSSLVSSLTSNFPLPAPPDSPTHAFEGPQTTPTKTEESLSQILLQTSQPLSLSSLSSHLEALQSINRERQFLSAGYDHDTGRLGQIVCAKLAVRLYEEALKTLLNEAVEAQHELQWWNGVERSGSHRVALYLLQTLPERIVRLTATILSAVQHQGRTFHLSLLTPSSLRNLFPSRGVLHPNTLTIALFPHLHAQPYSIALFKPSFPSPSAFATAPRESFQSALKASIDSVQSLLQSLVAFVTIPIALTRSECKFKRKELEKIRDDRAETLGKLAQLRDALAAALAEDTPEQRARRLQEFSVELQAAVQGEERADGQDTVEALSTFARDILPSQISYHTSDIRSRELMRPSQLTLLWPKLVFIPPLTIYAIRSAYTSRATLIDVAKDSWETVKSFWEQWLVEPLKGVIQTVRTGGDDSVIITKESVKSDLDSLERMTLALARDKLRYDSAQMAALARQIQMGDLTPVLQIYEEDIKSPLKSAVGGTLLRSLFIQVQKAKVDIDQALSGIDKLLKSQELTFAFVGVAPALAVVYGTGTLLMQAVTGGKKTYGSKKHRADVWLTVRRIERLLITQPTSHRNGPHDQSTKHAQTVPPITPLTTGLLLLSLTSLRSYAEKHLPPDSHIREGFLEDVADLENPTLGRAEKLHVLDRMWRSWGELLGWGQAAGER